MNLRPSFSIAASLALALLVTNLSLLRAQAPAPPAPESAPADAKPALSQEELTQILAPVALYPDSLLSQVLMAATYPLEVVEADRWVKAHPELKGDALAVELEKQSWDASVKSLVNFPTVLSTMSEKLDITLKIGDAFIADQQRVLYTVQDLRAKAQAAGNLKTNEQQKVVVEPAPPPAQQTVVVQSTPAPTQIIKIESPSPQVVYVPTYEPATVYGTYPYPSYPPPPYYPPRPPGYVASNMISFGVGVACGAAWGYAWGNCNWGGGDVDIDVNRNTNFNTNIDRSKYQANIDARRTNAQAGNRNSFQHDPAHRKGAAYRDTTTAQKYGGASNAKATQAREQYRGRSDAGAQYLKRGGGAGTADRTGAANRAGGAAAVDRSGAGAAERAGGGAANRAGTPADRSGAGPAQGRTSSASQARSSGSSSALSGVERGGDGARADSQRGQASRSASSSRSAGGGGSRSGGGGGGGRSGGGGGGGRR
jgi:hypothetical protein